MSKRLRRKSSYTTQILIRDEHDQLNDCENDKQRQFELEMCSMPHNGSASLTSTLQHNSIGSRDALAALTLAKDQIISGRIWRSIPSACSCCHLTLDSATDLQATLYTPHNEDV